jgi:hypothetical protein
VRTYLENTQHVKKELAQVVECLPSKWETEFRPQYCIKKKKKERQKLMKKKSEWEILSA